MLGIAEAPRAVFAIGLVNARGRACAVVERERIAEAGTEEIHEAPRAGGILEGKAPLASGTDDGDVLTSSHGMFEGGQYRREIDEGGEGDVTRGN